MTSQISTYAIATRALLYASAPTPLKISYDLNDPAVIRLELVSIGRAWHVARDRFTRGLEYSTASFDDEATEWAAAVHISQCSLTGRTLLIVRNRLLGRWPMTVSTEELRQFARITYRMCSHGREEQLIAADIERHLAKLTATQGGQP